MPAPCRLWTNCPFEAEHDGEEQRHAYQRGIAEVTEEACREQPKVRHDAGIDQIYITEWIYNGLSVTGDLFISE